MKPQQQIQWLLERLCNRLTAKRLFTHAFAEYEGRKGRERESEIFFFSLFPFRLLNKGTIFRFLFPFSLDKIKKNFSCLSSLSLSLPLLDIITGWLPSLRFICQQNPVNSIWSILLRRGKKARWIFIICAHRTFFVFLAMSQPQAVQVYGRKVQIPLD